MIAFDLQCSCRYCFEGWFESHEDFSRQQSEGLIRCPECDGTEVRKLLSAVTIRKQGRNPAAAVHGKDELGRQILEFYKSVQNFVEENFEDVGSRFAEESLKIHYGVEQPRNIRGVTTEEEEKMLENEGVDLLKVPIVSEKPDPDYN